VRILLDENLLSRKLKQPLIEAGHDVRNVDDMGWRGTKDTTLLTIANAEPFDVFITADKNLPYQQNFQNLTLKVIVLNSKSTRPDRLIPLIIQVIPLLTSLETGSVTTVDELIE
jgi:predicted nuclease of predicted toxin-antitoxin system